MTWDFYGEKILTADMSGTPRVFQPISVDKKHALIAVKAWFVFFNSPSFTTLSMKIYSYKNSQPYQALYTFDKTWALSAITSEAYASKEIYFDSDNAFTLRENETYALVPFLSGYTGTSSSHVAFVRGVPDPTYSNNYTLTYRKLLVAPFKVGLIGARLA